MRTIPRITCLWLLLTAFTAAGVRAETASPMLQAMREELTRSVDLLKRQPVPPYYLSYEITETHLIRIGASFGALSYNNERRSRMLDIDLRVGDYALDNTHQVRGSITSRSDRYSRIAIPIHDDVDAVRSVLWYHSDKKYKRAIEQLTTVKTNVQVKVEEEDRSDDFSREPVERYVEEPVSLDVPRDEWVNRVKKYTAPFAKDGSIYEASASLLATVSTRQFVSSEGTRSRRHRCFTVCSSTRSRRLTTEWSCRATSPIPLSRCKGCQATTRSWPWWTA